MTLTPKFLLCASALALSLPAAAQDTAMPDVPESAAWADVIEPSIRFIQRDRDGNVTFDSDMAESAPGTSDPELADKIAAADGPTMGATDTREMDGDEIVSLRWMPSARRADLAASPESTRIEGADGRTAGMQPMDQDMMAAVDDTTAPQTDGSYGMVDSFVSPTGVEIDIDAFARELFEQGYRRGYVSGLTEMRTRAVRQMQGERAQFARYRDAMEERARAQSAAMREVLESTREPQMERRGDGSTVIMLPPGMTPQDFLRRINQN